jgi:fumarate reductase flavoprotein subunit
VATSLARDRAGRVTGVRIATAQGAEEITAGAVVLADGGFQANEVMMRRQVGPQAHQMKLRSLGTQRGDGIAMGVAVGAATLNMQYFYGHMLSLDALDNDNLWPYPTLDQAICDGILVGRDGRRFTDEQVAGTGSTRDAVSGVAVANVVGRSEDPRGAIVIGDHRRPPDPAIAAVADAGGTVWRADDLAGLARQAGVDPQRLEDTVADFNAATRAGRTGRLVVPRQGSPAPIAVPPFHALPCVAAVTYTLGGLRISPQAEVLTADGDPIPHLYAAGATAGGIGGGPRGGYLGGLGTALVLGLAAAEHLAAAPPVRGTGARRPPPTGR